MLKKGIPRHSQISQWLRNQIDEGVYEADEKLPSENDLAKKFDVSRVTIRRALQSLESESIIYRCQGLGSFVSNERASHDLVKLTDFNEDMAKAGLEASSVVKKFEMVDAPDWLLPLLNIDEGSKILQIDRLRLGDGEPIAFDSTWLPVLYGQLLDEKELAESTIYHLLEKNYDIPVIRGCYKLSAEVADTPLADALNVEEKSPLFVIDRLSYTIGDKPLYYQKRYYRNDKVTYQMTLEREPGDEHGSSLPLKEFVPVFGSNETSNKTNNNT
ncbi:MAG: GntR family transcriptional regulator [Balneolaceae bacterium]|nr:GntR family transcriptional regulator [Balneolaceae bacterium]